MTLRIQLPITEPGLQTPVYTPEPQEQGKPQAQLDAMRETMDAYQKVQREEQIADIRETINIEELHQF